MKHLITLIQIVFWVVADAVLFIFYFKWDMYMHKPKWNGFLKQQNGVVRRANNAESYKKQYDSKYVAAFS